MLSRMELYSNITLSNIFSYWRYGMRVRNNSQTSVCHQTLFFLLKHPVVGSRFIRNIMFLQCAACEIFFWNFSVSQKTPQLWHRWIWSNEILSVNTRIPELNTVFIIIIQNSAGYSKWDKAFTTNWNYNFWSTMYLIILFDRKLF